MPPRRRFRGGVALLLACTALAACSFEAPGPPGEDAAGREELESRIGRVLDRSIERIQASADSVDDLLQPVPLLRPGERSDLRRYLNEAHLARARSLGVRPDGAAAIPALVEEGRLVELEDTTEYWVVRELDHSVPYVTPDARELLVRIGRRFQARLDSMGLPPYRFEVSSVLRTAEQQAELRGANPNAAGGTSTHEFGTTVDIPYSGYAAPAEPMVEPDLTEAPWLASRVRRMVDGMAELVAARKSRELMAILGRVLREMQSEGKVYVTLEAQQPVYHITVAQRLAETD